MNANVDPNNIQDFFSRHYADFSDDELKDLLAYCMAWSRNESLGKISFNQSNMQTRTRIIHKMLTDRMTMEQLLEQARDESEELVELKHLADEQALEGFYKQYAYTQKIIRHRLIASKVASVPVAASKTDTPVVQGDKKHLQAESIALIDEYPPS